MRLAIPRSPEIGARKAVIESRWLPRVADGRYGVLLALGPFAEVVAERGVALS